MQIALGLCRFASYPDKKRGERQAEVAKLFKALLYYYPEKREKRREIWELVFEISCRYFSKLMDRHNFEIGRFIQGVFDSEKDTEMGYTPSPNFFATIFPKEAQQLQQYQQQIFVANAIADEEHSKYEETSAKLKALEHLLCDKTRKDVYQALNARAWFDEIPQDIANVLERMTSYTRLEGVLEAAQNEKTYDDFLKALKKIRR